MKEYEKGFDLVFGKNSKEVFIIIYQTPFKKNKKITFNVDKINKKMIITYPKDKLVYENLEDSVIDILRRSQKLTVLEVEVKGTFTTGNIIDTYEMRAK